MESRRNYQTEIDGLRALAVAAVVLFHAGLGLDGGFAGVDVFFAISGYLITSQIVEHVRTGRFSLIGFWGRRMRRLVPASLLVTLVTIAIGAALLTPEELSAAAHSAAAQSVFLSNIHFSGRDAADYFSTAAETWPLLHTWSLSLEEQFYLFLPLTVLAVHRWAPRRLAAALVMLATASFLMCLKETSKDPTDAFYLPEFRVWELLGGSLLALWSREHRLQTGGRVARVLAITGLLLVLIPFFVYDKTTAFPGVAALAPVLGTLMLIASTRNGVDPVSHLLRRPTLVWIGQRSYSLYLWHWPVFAYYRVLYGPEVPAAHAVALVLCVTLLSHASYHLIENPFRRRATGRPVGTVLVYATALLITGATWLAIQRGGGLPGRFDGPHVDNVSHKGLAYESTRAAIEEDAVPQLGAERPASETPDFAVWGDSHAMAIAHAIDEAAQSEGVSGFILARSATAPIPTSWWKRKDDPEWNAAAESYILKSGVRDVVLVARWIAYLDGQPEVEWARPGSPPTLRDATREGATDAGPADRPEGGPTSIAARGLIALTRRLAAKDVRVWILRQGPELERLDPGPAWLRSKLPLAAALAPFEISPQPAIETDRASRSDSMSQVIAQVVRAMPSVRTITQPLEFQSDDGAIVTQRDGLILWRDNDHVSKAGARFFYSRTLRQVLGGLQSRAQER